MTRLYLGGAETPTLKNRLVSAGAERVSFNYWSLHERSTRPDLGDLVPSHVSIVLDSGFASANEDPGQLDTEEWWAYIEDYLATVDANLERIDFATEFAFLGLGLDGIQMMRDRYWLNIPEEKWAAVWMPGMSLEEMAETFRRVVIPAPPRGEEEALELARRLRALTHTTGVQFHIQGSTSPVWPRVGRVETMASSGWTAPARFGETLLWDGHDIRRLSKGDKDKRKRHRNLVEGLGCDPKKVEAGDAEELSVLAIKSLLAWEERYAGDDVADTPARKPRSTDAQPTPSTSVTPREEVRKIEAPEGRKMLPILAMTQKVDQTGEHPIEMQSEDASLRACDDCSLKAYCPEFEANSTCAYSLPVRIRTREQLSSVMATLLEMQSKRAMFAAFSEELQGDVASKKVSAEMERFFAMAEKMQSINDSRDFMRVTVEAHSGAGMLSRLFGDRTAQAAGALPSPVDSDEVIAEVIEDRD